MQKLGQHFLKNKLAVKKIIDSLEIESGDSIIEIGPGHGELTERLLVLSFELLEKNGLPPIRIIAIEKDGRLASLLKEKFRNDSGIKIIEGDALKVLKSPIPHTLPPTPYKLVGNIPYYITGKLLRILSEMPHKPELCVFTIQKEVAERITAKPPRMNRLAAIVQFWAEPKIISLIPRKDFEPQPNVDSAIIKLSVKHQVSGAGSERRKVFDLDYYKTVKMLFAQPRKTILNNISFGIKELLNKKTGNIHSNAITNQKEVITYKLKKLRIDPNGRPQDLDVAQIRTLAEMLLDDTSFEVK